MSSQPDARFSRQVKLAEVGQEGQRRLAAWEPRAPLLLPAGAHAYLSEYLVRMGISRPLSEDEDACLNPTLPPALSASFRHAAPRAIGLGAAAALANALSALELPRR